ncbi:MAG: hypothetical protein LBS96_08795 [Oscillospiraceae bacterium]|jgi:hypothetical protein|nr:hypothetical protein [Oscillospiraceae bacterium]
MLDVLSILSTLFGTAAGTHELLGGAWGWLQLIVDAILSISDSVTALLGA